MRSAWVVALLVACKSKGTIDTDPRTLEALVDRYQAAMQDVAKAVETGTCADKAAALAPVVTRHRPVFEQMAAAVNDTKAREAITAIIDTRDEAIAAPEIAFKQARFDCKDDAKFDAVIASMPH